MHSFGKYLGLLSLGLIISGCGGSGESDNASISESQVSIGFSDFPVESASSVVITVDAITFVAPSGEQIRIDTFSSNDLELNNADTFQFDLLEVQGNDFKLVLDDVVLPVGEYSELRIEVIDENTQLSYVEELGSGNIRELKVPSEELKLGGFTVEPLSTQTFIVEFDLSQAMTYNPGPQRYILKPRGVRVVGLELASTVMGNIDIIAMANLSDVCEVGIGNVMYLYENIGLNNSLLLDNVDPSIVSALPPGAIPYASATVGITGDYLFSFVEPGNYTLAYTCLGLGDHSETYDQIPIPGPDTEWIELTLGSDEQFVCDFPLNNGNCSSN